MRSLLERTLFKLFDYLFLKEYYPDRRNEWSTNQEKKV
jgi:hypothetical protein